MSSRRGPSSNLDSNINYFVNIHVIQIIHAAYNQFWLSVQKLTFDPDRCFPIAVGILGRDLLLLQLMLVACADVMADGLANLVNKPGPVVVDGGCWISNDCVPSMLPSPARFGF